MNVARPSLCLAGSAALLGALVLSGCSSSAGKSVDVNAFADRLSAAYAQLQSAHVEFAIDGGPLATQGLVDEKLRDGHVYASQLSQNGTSIVTVDGRSYASLSSSEYPDKPWVLVSPTSSEDEVRQLAATLGAASTATGPDVIESYTRAAKSVHDRGTATVNDTSTEHYTITFDVDHLTGDAAAAIATLKSVGITEVPLDIYLDKQDRPAEVAITVKVQGQEVSEQFLYTYYRDSDEVTIKAPSADQVRTD